MIYVILIDILYEYPVTEKTLKTSLFSSSLRSLRPLRLKKTFPYVTLNF